MTVPEWVQDSVFYQIFPDRFANGDLSNDPYNVQAWGSPPTSSKFQGGDLRGIIQKFDYLLDLGINAIYLNPIFQSPSNHRYSTIDYYRIDPKLGDNNDFYSLIDIAHRHGVKVILDGVFNHCSRGFFAFVDLLENREASPYVNWFHVHRFPVDAYSPGKAKDYLAWWGIKSLPKFNTNTPDVRRYLLGVARYWIEQGADGWRLDVPNEIDDDSFWAEFRHVVKSVNPDAYLVGEIWNADKRWVGEGHFDGLMNYPFRNCVLRLLRANSSDSVSCAHKFERLLSIYSPENAYAMYLLLGSHDTERVMTLLDGDEHRIMLAYLLLFSYPGAPAVYYGDEVGMLGGKDPECRGAFPWDPFSWNQALRQWIKTLISARKRLVCMRRGAYIPILDEDKAPCISFARKLADEAVLVVLNASPTRQVVHLPVGALSWSEGRIVCNVFGEQEYLIADGKVEVDLPAWGGVWLK
jgi:glycosidase